MFCIYCKKSAQGSKSRAHCFPEAIVPNGPALPPGVVCDRCNHYFGANLESMLLRHGYIALVLQLAGIPGKKGKARKRLGVFERENDGAVAFPISPPSFKYNKVGIREGSFSIGKYGDPKFDMDKFRRALYHIGMNLAALNLGVAAVMEREFDALRRYVRNPKPKERWPFIEWVEQLRYVEPGVDACDYGLDGDMRIIGLRILNCQFRIDLLNSGRLETAKVTGPVTVVGRKWEREEPVGPVREGKYDVHFRAVIR